MLPVDYYAFRFLFIGFPLLIAYCQLIIGNNSNNGFNIFKQQFNTQIQFGINVFVAIAFAIAVAIQACHEQHIP